MAAPVSVVIPALNAAGPLRDCLAALVEGAEAGLVCEVVVADGGSSDDTAAVAEAAGARFVSSPPGRGVQLRAGADAARGAWLLFLHADSWLEPGWSGAVGAHLLREEATARPKAGVFELGYRSSDRRARWLERRVAWRVRRLGLPYGDQGLLISRSAYHEAGGHPPLPLFEDVRLIERIGRRGFVVLEARAMTSADKYERDGYRKRGWRNAWLLARYKMGADPERLAGIYR